MSAARRSPARSAVGQGRWLAPLHDWPRTVLAALQREPAMVRVLVASLRGSGPRETGACMLIGQDGISGTIGGGYLEWQAQRAALALLLDASAPAAQVRKLILGVELGQCCGGVVELWLERFTLADEELLQQATHGDCGWRSTLNPDGTVERKVLDYPLSLRERGRGEGRSRPKSLNSEVGRCPSSPALLPEGEGSTAVRLTKSESGSWTLLEDLGSAALPVYLYGAGHVGQALVSVLAGLPYAVHWIDSRAELLPADVPDNVYPLCTAWPLQTVPTAAATARHVVMTHDHALDYALCRAILLRGDAAFVGVIGSHSKGARFRSRLARDGLRPEQIAPLVCPIGIAGIVSKQPAAIAVAIAAQLLQLAPTSPEAAPGPATSSLSTAETCTAEDCGRCPQQRRLPPPPDSDSPCP